MADPKQVVEPEEAIGHVPVAAAPAETGTPKVTVVFWKRTNPFEKLKFADKTELVFGRQTFATADEKVIGNIRSVADHYGIIEQ